jgi:hypothetical protein
MTSKGEITMPTPAQTAKKNSSRKRKRTLDARADTLDFRDRMFEPSLIEVPTEISLDSYRRIEVPILDQGQEGACTGFGLATVIHYLLRTRQIFPDKSDVSPRMLYNMARRYDQWPGANYSGSSARGAMKGWHKHGVCSSQYWVYDSKRDKQDKKLFCSRYEEALRRPLGAYLRVNHKDIIAMHSAISEVKILYATSAVHEGWDDVDKDGLIYWSESNELTGGHAFAIVAYDENGFWIQNSWGTDWGREGFAQISYDDWLANGTDVWVARLGAPISLHKRVSTSLGVGAPAEGTRSYVFSNLRPHIISLGNDGEFRPEGTYGTSEEDVLELFDNLESRVAQEGGPEHLVIYAHGGLTAEDSAVQKIADLRVPLLGVGVYPIELIWKTDFWSTAKDILQDAIKQRRPEGILDSTKDFMLDRLDDAIEPIARALGGKTLWDEMKENAELASTGNGGLVLLSRRIEALLKKTPSLKVHLVGHSAGSIMLGGLVRNLHKQKILISTCTLWAPACTTKFFRDNYLPAISEKAVENFCVFALTDDAERKDNCANVYHKSLLYLVSNAFEEFLRQPQLGKKKTNPPRHSGEPILGMARWIKADLDPAERQWDLVLSPNTNKEGRQQGSRSISHGGFDDDSATLKATLARILGRAEIDADFSKGSRSMMSNRSTRAALTQQS